MVDITYPWYGQVMLLDNLSDVAVFVQVVESEGLSAAARVLRIPPNTISRTVARLEAALGVLLLVRTTRRVHLTDEGRAFYEQSTELLEAARRAEAAVASDGLGLSGLVRIAVRTTTVQFAFVPDLLQLLGEHSQLQVQLQVVDDDVDLVAMGLDLALRIGGQADSSLKMRRLGEVTFVLAAAPAYIERCGRPTKPEDLGQHECIRQQVGPKSAWNLRGPQAKQLTVLVGGRFGCRDVRTQRDAIYAGFGIGLRPAGEVRSAQQVGELERLLPRWALEPIPVYALLPPRPSPQRARAVDAICLLLERAVSRMS